MLLIDGIVYLVILGEPEGTRVPVSELLDVLVQFNRDIVKPPTNSFSNDSIVLDLKQPLPFNFEAIVPGKSYISFSVLFITTI